MTPSVSSEVKTSIAPVSPGRGSELANTSHTAISTAVTIPATASANSSTSHVALRRAAAWCSKKFISRRQGQPVIRSRGNGHCAPADGSRIPGSELDLRRRPHLGLLSGRDLQQRRGREIEHAGDDTRGEHLAPVVVAHDTVVEGLPGERDLVFGRGQLLGELHHVLVSLEVRVRLGDGQQAAERAVELLLGRGQLPHGGGVAGAGLGGGQAGDGGAAGGDDRFQGLSFVSY